MASKVYALAAAPKTVCKDHPVSDDARGAGHVFVIKGNKRHLACDVYLQSTDRDLSPTGGWLKAIPDAASRLDSQERADFEREARFAIPVRVTDPESREATPVLVAVPYYGTTHADQLRERVQAYFDVAAQVVADRRVSHGERPLVALPIFAAQGGGGGPVKGDILRVLYDEGRKAATDYGFDVTLVLDDPRAYDLAQVIRREHALDPWQALDSRQAHLAQELGRDAGRRRLVPFMGSGISVTAGAPTWRDLISQLAVAAGLTSSDADALSSASRDVLDQAAYLHRAFAQQYPDSPRAFAQSVIALVDKPRYGLAPALLASLEAEQAITLNYDRLFELAAADAQLPRRVIPGPSSGDERWVLKLHGTVTDPESIVLTRADYLGFDSDRSALSSLVKATLMTRRLLFVGFGMSDAHFHEIVHDVRRALPATTHGFGTVLTLHDNPVTQRLWEGDLEFVVFDSPRTLDIFLDAVMAFAADSHSYLLAKGYESTLPPADSKLASSLHTLLGSADDVARESVAWPILRQALLNLGWDGR